jgi:hypothetical protein
MIRFSLKYFILSLLLFITEVLIALYVNDAFVRPYVGDYLVVIFIYCVVRTFIKASVLITAAGVLLFSYVIEVLQYFHFVNLLGLEHNTIARVALGTSFAWSDLVAYTLGIFTVILMERLLNKQVVR